MKSKDEKKTIDSTKLNEKQKISARTKTKKKEKKTNKNRKKMWTHAHTHGQNKRIDAFSYALSVDGYQIIAQLLQKSIVR